MVGWYTHGVMILWDHVLGYDIGTAWMMIGYGTVRTPRLGTIDSLSSQDMLFSRLSESVVMVLVNRIQ
jgi:hypothetical protein